MFRRFVSILLDHREMKLVIDSDGLLPIDSNAEFRTRAHDLAEKAA